jgi:hypothetical protein
MKDEMKDEMEYMRISQYCLNLIQKNLKQFFEEKYKTLIENEYKSSPNDSFFDIMFYFSVIKNNINSITEFSKVIFNTIHSIKSFRNKIAHQAPITLREFYRFVDDTQIMIEMLNICDKNEIEKIENTRKEIIRRMNMSNDNNIIIGANYNRGKDKIGNSQKKIINDIEKNNSDIEMGDYEDENYNECNFNQEYKNYNTFNFQETNNIYNKNYFDEKLREEKINKNFEVIMKNQDQEKFFKVNNVHF